MKLIRSNDNWRSILAQQESFDRALEAIRQENLTTQGAKVSLPWITAPPHLTGKIMLRIKAEQEEVALSRRILGTAGVFGLFLAGALWVTVGHLLVPCNRYPTDQVIVGLFWTLTSFVFCGGLLTIVSVGYKKETSLSGYWRGKLKREALK